MRFPADIRDPTTSNCGFSQQEEEEEKKQNLFSSLPTSSSTFFNDPVPSTIKTSGLIENSKVILIKRKEYIRAALNSRTNYGTQVLRWKRSCSGDQQLNLRLYSSIQNSDNSAETQHTKQLLFKKKISKCRSLKMFKLSQIAKCLLCIMPLLLIPSFCTSITTSSYSIDSVVAAFPSTDSLNRLENSQYYESPKKGAEKEEENKSKPSFEEVLIAETQKRDGKSLASAANAAEVAEETMQRISDSPDLDSIIVPSPKAKSHHSNYLHHNSHHKNSHQKHEKKQTLSESVNTISAPSAIDEHTDTSRTNHRHSNIQAHSTSAALSSNLFKEYLTRGLYNCTANYIGVITKLQELIRDAYQEYMKCEKERRGMKPTYPHTDFEALNELLTEWKEGEDASKQTA